MYSLVILYKLLVNLDNISDNCFLSNCGNSVSKIQKWIYILQLYNSTFKLIIVVQPWNSLEMMEE